jgi:nucleoid-associated protein YgaU
MGRPDARGDRGAAEDGEVGGAISGNGAPPPGSRGDSPARSERGSVYTVVSGDTLSKIARRVYGTNSRRCIDALFEANRKTLKTADALSVGEVLVIPHVAGERVSPDAASSRGAGDARPSEGNDARRDSGRPLGARRSAEHVDAAGGAFRWYQVRAKDRYVSIAREQLGDGSRWKEIFDLNKDRFPDPDRIREGVRIKLPSASSVALAGDRR